MNILIDQLPTAVLIDGKEYAIETDFRACLKVIIAFEDPELIEYEKMLVALAILYKEQPPDPVEAMRTVVKFLNGGNETEEVTGKRVYSFVKDRNLIYAAFRQTHGIDLQEIPDMHWWKFLALFMDLGSETVFCNLVALRKRLKDGTATKEERALAREIGEMFDVPDADTRTPDERDQEAEFLRLVAEGEAKRKAEVNNG